MPSSRSGERGPVPTTVSNYRRKDVEAALRGALARGDAERAIGLSAELAMSDLHGRLSELLVDEYCATYVGTDLAALRRVERAASLLQRRGEGWEQSMCVLVVALTHGLPRRDPYSQVVTQAAACTSCAASGAPPDCAPQVPALASAVKRGRTAEAVFLADLLARRDPASVPSVWVALLEAAGPASAGSWGAGVRSAHALYFIGRVPRRPLPVTVAQRRVALLLYAAVFASSACVPDGPSADDPRLNTWRADEADELIAAACTTIKGICADIGDGESGDEGPCGSAYDGDGAPDNRAPEESFEEARIIDPAADPFVYLRMYTPVDHRAAIYKATRAPCGAASHSEQRVLTIRSGAKKNVHKKHLDPPSSP